MAKKPGRFLVVLGLFVMVSGISACSTGVRKLASDVSDDPYLWLEDIESQRSLSWAQAHNEKTIAHLKSRPDFGKWESQIREILLAKDRIPSPGLDDGWIYNFWQDQKHVKGIWRRTSLENYQKAEIDWEVLLDLDELSKKENESWVFKGAQCLHPEKDRCLISLSRGGKDAVEVREFKISEKNFVSNGFFVPEAKSDLAWKDENTLFIGTDFGPGSMTSSGYPRQVRLWKRGTPLASAKLIYEAQETDMSTGAVVMHRLEGTRFAIYRQISFYEAETFLLGEDDRMQPIPFPASASFLGLFKGKLFATLRKPWAVSGRTIPEGSIVNLPLDQIKATDVGAHVSVVYTPNSRSSVAGVVFTRDYLYLTVLENVETHILQMKPSETGWTSKKVPIQDHGTAGVWSESHKDNRILISYQNFLTPSSFYLFDDELTLLKQAPARFDSKGMVVEQFHSTSKDGTQIPYFVVRRKDVSLNGKNPALLYGYGGFEISMDPYYLGATGKVWLENGGIYVLANIRGGGEFGPKWHEAALKQNRQKAYDDFISVGEDLVKRQFTSPRHLAIQGGSNGGLLVGAVFVQRPDLFNKVVCQVPLLDMLRYHKLLAGSSWMGEYGDPDDDSQPEVQEAIRRYSPYQNVRQGVKYPKVFFMTSTKDDRVHPGHARKMVARMEEQGHTVLYYENIEGGHGGAADLEQRIFQSAMMFTYLFD